MKMTLDLDMSLGDIAKVFEEQGWEYGGPKCYGVPDKEDLAWQVGRLAADIEEDDLDYIHCGRLALVRDPEVDSTFQVLLTVGYLYVDGELEEID